MQSYLPQTFVSFLFHTFPFFLLLQNYIQLSHHYKKICNSHEKIHNKLNTLYSILLQNQQKLHLIQYSLHLLTPKKSTHLEEFD